MDIENALKELKSLQEAFGMPDEFEDAPTWPLDVMKLIHSMNVELKQAEAEKAELEAKFNDAKKAREDLTDYVGKLLSEKAELVNAIESLRTVIAFDSRDWSLIKNDSWIYAILVGWDDAFQEICAKHRFDYETKKRLQKYNDAILSLLPKE